MVFSGWPRFLWKQEVEGTFTEETEDVKEQSFRGHRGQFKCGAAGREVGDWARKRQSVTWGWEDGRGCNWGNEQGVSLVSWGVLATGCLRINLVIPWGGHSDCVSWTDLTKCRFHLFLLDVGRCSVLQVVSRLMWQWVFYSRHAGICKHGDINAQSNFTRNCTWDTKMWKLKPTTFNSKRLVKTKPIVKGLYTWGSPNHTLRHSLLFPEQPATCPGAARAKGLLSVCCMPHATLGAFCVTHSLQQPLGYLIQSHGCWWHLDVGDSQMCSSSPVLFPDTPDSFIQLPALHGCVLGISHLTCPEPNSWFIPSASQNLPYPINGNFILLVAWVKNLNFIHLTPNSSSALLALP